MSITILKFEAEWCVPCKVLAGRLEEAGDLNGATLRSVDIEQEPDLVEKFSVRSVPTLVFLDNAGEEFPNTRLNGLVPVSNIMAVVTSLS